MIRLMIKTHNVTELKYLCVSTKDDYLNYPGSGVKWRNHLKQHGFNFSTVVLYESQVRNDIFKSMCLYYSRLYDVVNSDEWANLIMEDGNTGSAYAKHSEQSRNNRSELFLSLFAQPGGVVWKRNIGLASRQVWASYAESERLCRIEKLKAVYTEDKRKEHSVKLKEAYANMSEEQIKQKGKILSEKYQSQSDDWKTTRGNKISSSLQESDAFASYVDSMKEDRVGGGNPAARVVHWDGMKFDTCTDFYKYIRENKIISKNAAERILKTNPTDTRYIASKKTGEKLYENHSN